MFKKILLGIKRKIKFYNLKTIKKNRDNYNKLKKHGLINELFLDYELVETKSGYSFQRKTNSKSFI